MYRDIGMQAGPTLAKRAGIRCRVKRWHAPSHPAVSA